MMAAEHTRQRSDWVMRVLMLVGGGHYQALMLNADTNRENNPIYIALGRKHYIIHSLYTFIHFMSQMQNIVVKVDTTILHLQYL